MHRRNRQNLHMSMTLPLALGAVSVAHAASLSFNVDQTIIGSDLNSALNLFVQDPDPALTGGGRDQSLQFGDVLAGGGKGDLIIGRLGVDILMGRKGHDVLVGGPEHFNPRNRDLAFGGAGKDAFIWSPGDGSDRFDGGEGIDTVIFGLIGENGEGGGPVFQVSTDQQAGDVYINPDTNLPLVDVAGSPGFCEVIDGWTTNASGPELEDLGLDHLVRFFIRGIADSFESGDQDEDNGLRVTLHLKDVEYVVCTARAGGEIEVLDLTQSPPASVPYWVLPPRVQALLVD